MKELPELKRCPFCGAEASYDSRESLPIVICDYMYCTAETCGKTHEEAAERWNRRASDNTSDAPKA